MPRGFKGVSTAGIWSEMGLGLVYWAMELEQRGVGVRMRWRGEELVGFGCRIEKV